MVIAITTSYNITISLHCCIYPFGLYFWVCKLNSTSNASQFCLVINVGSYCHWISVKMFNGYYKIMGWVNLSNPDQRHFVLLIWFTLVLGRIFEYSVYSNICGIFGTNIGSQILVFVPALVYIHSTLARKVLDKSVLNLDFFYIKCRLNFVCE